MQLFFTKNVFFLSVQFLIDYWRKSQWAGTEDQVQATERCSSEGWRCYCRREVLHQTPQTVGSSVSRYRRGTHKKLCTVLWVICDFLQSRIIYIIHSFFPSLVLSFCHLFVRSFNRSFIPFLPFFVHSIIFSRLSAYLFLFSILLLPVFRPLGWEKQSIQKLLRK